MWCTIKEMEEVKQSYGGIKVPLYLWSSLPILHRFKTGEGEYFDRKCTSNT